MRLVILTSFLFVFVSTRSQPPLSDTIDYIVSKLVSFKGDTVVSLYSDHPHYAISDTVKGIGEIREFELAYLLCKSGNQTYATKHINYFEEIMSYNYANSRPINFSGDSIFSFLSKNWEEVTSSGATLPYTYKTKTDSSDQFNVLRASHPSIYYIRIRTKESDFNYYINIDDMQYRASDHHPVNINYQYNINSKQYLLFGKIRDLIERIDDKFVFKK
jgi:hypothetical protein